LLRLFLRQRYSNVVLKCAGVAVVHVLQALLYLCWGRSKGFFTCGELLSHLNHPHVILASELPFAIHCCSRQVSVGVSFACHWLVCVVFQESEEAVQRRSCFNGGT
jgi:hypothetical protein